MWKTVKIGDVTKFVRGLTYSKKDEVKSDGVAVLRATNIDLANHKIVLDDIRFVNKSVKIKEEKYARMGDLLVCTASGSKSHVGKVALAEEDLGMAFGSFMAALRCNKECYPKFLYCALISQQFKQHLTALSDGANINNLKFSQIEGYEFTMPPLLEQKRIVAKIDAAFAKIDNAVKLAEEKEAEISYLKKSLLSSVLRSVNWESVKVSDVCQIQPPKKQVKLKLNGDDEVSFMPMDMLGIETLYATTEQTKLLNKVYGSYTYFEDNDVLLAKITPCFENGKIGIATELCNGVGFGSSEYIVLRCDSKILPQYLYFYLAQPTFRIEGKKKMIGAVGHKRLPKEFVENKKISLPPISEQERIVAKLVAAFTEIETAKNAVTKTKENFAALKSAILAQELKPSKAA